MICNVGFAPPPEQDALQRLRTIPPKFIPNFRPHTTPNPFLPSPGQCTLLFHGHELLADADLEFNFGRRYGLLGPNGCGKSCLLTMLGKREVPIPNHIDIYHLDREVSGFT